MVHNFLRQALDDGGLAHAGLTQQNRVVLLPAAQHLDHALDFVHAPDHWVELVLAGHLGQITTEGIQRRRLALTARSSRRAGSDTRIRRTGADRLIRISPTGAEQVQHFLANLIQLESQVHQHLGSHAVLLAQQTQQQVLRTDIVVIQISGLFDRVLDDFLGPRRLRKLAHGDHLGAALDQLLDFQAHLPQINVQVLEHVGADARALLDQPEQDVLGADVFMVEALRFLIGQRHYFACTVSEPFEHMETPSWLPAGVPCLRKRRTSCKTAQLHPAPAIATRPCNSSTSAKLLQETRKCSRKCIGPCSAWIELHKPSARFGRLATRERNNSASDHSPAR